jgi:hypothetical protein
MFLFAPAAVAQTPRVAGAVRVDTLNDQIRSDRAFVLCRAPLKWGAKAADPGYEQNLG